MGNIFWSCPWVIFSGGARGQYFLEVPARIIAGISYDDDFVTKIGVPLDTHTFIYTFVFVHFLQKQKQIGTGREETRCGVSRWQLRTSRCQKSR